MHGALEEASAAKGDEVPDALAHVAAVLKVIAMFPERLQIIANVGDK